MLLSAAVLLGCGTTSEFPDLLATVGEVQIVADDLRVFDARSEGDTASRTDPRILLQTLIDRQLLLQEASALGLQQHEQVLSELEKNETRELADAMLARQVAQAVITQAEVERAYSRPGWDEQIRTLEIFVPTAAKASQILELLAGGMDFAEAGRQHSVDPYYGVPAGEARQSVYHPFDHPRIVVEAISGLSTGGVTAPVPLHGGFVITTVTARLKVELLQVSERIRETLLTEKRKQLRNSYLRHLKWDFGTSFHPEGMDLVVAVLRGEVAAGALDAEQRGLSVYAFEGFKMDVVEVLEAVGPARAGWSEVTADAVNDKLAQSHFPNNLMSRDARRKGVDQTEDFLKWRQARLHDLMLEQLREKVLAEEPDASEEDLEEFYQDNKRRFRFAAWARIQELLVEDPEQARELAVQIRDGAAMGPLASAHSQRKTVDGILDISTSHTPVYGEVWMNAVMNAPLNEVRGPVKTPGGYSVFTVLEMHPEHYYTLESERVRKAVTRDVRQQQQRESFNRYLEGLRQKHAAKIQLYEDNLESYIREVASEG